jgi:hypothetical protein
VLQYSEDGSYHNNSTPLIYELEKRHPGRRSIVPDDPGLALLAHLIEDLADEWVTKMMFIYRWWREVGQEYCSTWLSHLTNQAADPETIKAAAAEFFRDRQVGRMPVMTSSTTPHAMLKEGLRQQGIPSDPTVKDSLPRSRPSKKSSFRKSSPMRDWPRDRRTMKCFA